MNVDSLELIRPRSIGVEHVGKAALDWLQFPAILSAAGFNGSQQAAAIGSVIGRMAAPGSELATGRWLKGRSALGELLDFDYEGLPLMSLYRASDRLVHHRQAIEEALFSRIDDLFSLPTTVTLYDLTNTYFERFTEQFESGLAKLAAGLENLFITVLAYQAVQVPRWKFKGHGI